MVKRVTFEVAYEGLAVDEGVMDVRELAPALLALGELVENSNKLIGNPEEQIKVVVRSSFKKGSFQITLEVIQTLTEQLLNLLDSNKSANTAVSILGSLGFIAGTGNSLLPPPTIILLYKR